MVRHTSARLAPLAACLLLGACSTTQVAQVQPIDGVISGQCHIDKVRGAIGLAATQTTVERARVDSDSLKVQVANSSVGHSGATSSGVDSATRGAGESGGERLTIEVGPYNNITTLYCG
ncbi:hypothetical protein [Xanthomonas theicola]|uniref:Lipoprotein n=1 Tax=Xanthomonas theicola TaxID=56464 RepID=A0A2S6ZC03_9XANT|nr:hypothetical protein [Xanthomonas theicola]PPT83903.1 hypothetical protein XthCFBP4691_16635 [Xanthomonas theicola]QNH26188.1 hypothetical protein G4Q83_17590 [Xanthomonas theicola]